MKINFQKLRHFLVLIPFLAIAWVVQASVQLQKNSLCNGLEVKIDYDDGNYFVDESDIENMIRSQTIGKTLSLPVKDIDLLQLELFIEQNPYIKNAEIFFDINSKLWVEIEQQYPVARIVDAKNRSYYLSREGEKMPASSDYASRVLVVSGNIADNERDKGDIFFTPLKNIFLLAKYIDQNQFLKSLIEQIYVRPNGDWVLIPKIGDQEIIFGNIENMQEKFDNLLLFYREGLNNIGWNKYKTINLKFKDQVVCTKK